MENPTFVNLPTSIECDRKTWGLAILNPTNPPKSEETVSIVIRRRVNSDKGHSTENPLFQGGAGLVDPLDILSKWLEILVILGWWCIEETFQPIGSLTLPKTKMTMENPPFEDVFPIENRDFPIMSS